MSKFKTIIPTETQAFIETIAKRATIDGVALDPNTNNIIIQWQDDTLYTGLTVPVEFPVEMVKRGKLPPKVIKASERPKIVRTPVKEENAPEATPEAMPPIPVYLNEEQLREAVAKGAQIEYNGINPGWQPFHPKKDTFKAGYFYRVKKSVDQPVAVA